MKSVMGSKSLNHFCWIDQLYFCPSPRNARRVAAKKCRAYASWATTLAKVALSHMLATQLRDMRLGGQAGLAATAAAAVGGVADWGRSVRLPAVGNWAAAAGSASGATDIPMSATTASAATADAAAIAADGALDTPMSATTSAATGLADAAASAAGGAPDTPMSAEGSAAVGSAAATTSSASGKPWAAWKARTNSAT